MYPSKLNNFITDKPTAINTQIPKLDYKEILK